MEEVDKIIVHSLRGVGCDLDDDVQSLRAFSTEMIVEAVGRCLRVINNDPELSTSLPGGMSAKFRVGTSLANSLMELGYRGEIGYQTFLYSNETDIRKVMMFLVEKLPKESEEGGEEILGSSALLQRAVSAEVTKRLRSPWGPAYLRESGISWIGTPPTWCQEDEGSFQQFHSRNLTIPQDVTDINKIIPKGTKRYYDLLLPFVTNLPTRHTDVSPSVLEHNGCYVTAQQEWETEWNRSGLASGLTEEGYRSKKKQKILKRVGEQLRQSMQKARAAEAANDSQNLQQYLNSMSGRSGMGRTKGSRFTHAEKLQFAQDDKAVAQLGGDTARADTEEELQAKREDEIKQLNDELNNLTNELDKLELNCQKFKTNMQQMADQINQQEIKNSTEEESFLVKKRTMDLLPNADENIAKLQSVVESSTQRLVNLANQWEQHRAPLLQQYRELKDINSQKQSEAQEKLDQIKEFREKMKGVADEARGKEELYKQLLSEYERMTKEVNRSAYTRKIMEILSNIKKQKAEIEKVLIDTKAIQKEINQLSGKLDRTFTVTDELIFRDAKKDEAVKKAYKCLAALHENCDMLIGTVEETGGIMREIRELEDQIEVESKKKVLANLEKITEDFQQMKKENMSLIAKLKG